MENVMSFYHTKCNWIVLFINSQSSYAFAYKQWAATATGDLLQFKKQFIGEDQWQECPKYPACMCSERYAETNMRRTCSLCLWALQSLWLTTVNRSNNATQVRPHFLKIMFVSRAFRWGGRWLVYGLAEGRLLDVQPLGESSQPRGWLTGRTHSVAFICLRDLCSKML